MPGIVRSLAPEAEIHSVRVLGPGFTGGGNILLVGLRYAIEQGFEVINMSLSTTKKDYAAVLHELADSAYFQRSDAGRLRAQHARRELPVAVLLGDLGRQPRGGRPDGSNYNPNPPVEFFARGVNVEVAWMGGEDLSASGNSFATPHVSAICALVRSKHPELTPFQLKSVLHLTAANVGGNR